MNAILTILAVQLAIASLINKQELSPNESEHAIQTIEQFVRHVQSNPQYPNSAKSFINKEWQKRREGNLLRDFIPQSLALLNPRFQLALQALEKQEYAWAAKLFGESSSQPDPYLASHAAIFQAQALIQDAQLEYAQMLLGYCLRDGFNLADYTLLADQATFWRGFCLFHLFENQSAQQILEQFLTLYPQASPQQRTEVQRMLDELKQPRLKNLDQVTHLMSDAGRRLADSQTGLETQIAQQDSLRILEELARQAEDQEQQQQQQQQSQNQGQAQNRQPSRGNQQSGNPAPQSNTPAGQSGTGPLHDSPRANPAQSWGQMKPQEREKIMQLLQQNFPSRYRELVEQYYSELAKQKE